MGKLLRAQRRGKGSFTFIATKRGMAIPRYIALDEHQKEAILRGEVQDIVTDRGRTSVLAEVLFEDSQKEFLVAAEGLKKGQSVEFGTMADIQIGNVLPLGKIPEGCPVFAIERKAGDGGSLALAAGAYGLVMSKTAEKAFVKMPSGKTVELPLQNRATIGCCACGGRDEKPFLKAGSKFYWMKRRRRHYPGLRGVAMNALDHPFGGSQHHAGKSKSTSRNKPPGRKVGAIASSRTGRRKR